MLDMHKIIDEIGFGGYHLMLIFFVGTFFTVDNAFLIMSASITTTLQRDWNLHKLQKAMLVSILFFGAAAGSIVSGSFSDIHGRRPMVLISLCGELVFGFGCCLTNSINSMLLLRFMFGLSVGIGMAPVISMLVEGTPSRWRGHMVNGVTGLMYGLGLLYSCIIIMVYMPDLDGGPSPMTWRYITALSVLPCAVVFPFVCLLVPESPHFLVSRGRNLEALAVLRFMAFVNGNQRVTELLEAEFKQTLEEQGQGLTQAKASSGLLGWQQKGGAMSYDGKNPSSKILNQGGAEVAVRSAGFFEMYDTIVTSGFLPIVKGGCFMYFLVNATVNGLSYGLPQILATVEVDMNPALSLFCVSLCDYPALFLACAITEMPKVSYRQAMKGLCGASFFFIAILASFDYGWSRVALFSVCIAKILSVALFQLVFAYFSEIFPSGIRCTANCICMAAGRLGSVLAPLDYELLSYPIDNVGPHTPFFIFLALLCVVGVHVIDSLLSMENKNNPLMDFDEEQHISDLAPPTVGSALPSRASSVGVTRENSRRVSFVVSEDEAISAPESESSTDGPRRPLKPIKSYLGASPGSLPNIKPALKKPRESKPAGVKGEEVEARLRQLAQQKQERAAQDLAGSGSSDCSEDLEAQQSSRQASLETPAAPPAPKAPPVRGAGRGTSLFGNAPATAPILPAAKALSARAPAALADALSESGARAG
eukprot:TRINITY_DN28594_c0_g2_i1.p1 TRINITY_DN28594_c0_g2~~TRINITY_DN28594_c0_g2_i1.p1  ORF type:complete len:707 (-),score=114.14 TRINITY_DN28594_c0_g2_i1:39-2159(-)